MTILGLKGILTSMLPDHLWKNLLTFFSMLHKHIDHTLHIAGHRHFFPVCQHKISGAVNITHTTHFHLVTYTTMSANLMLREIGIALFLAAVGIGAGDGFIDAIVDGGYRWIGYGVIITVLPLIIVALVARLWLKMNYYTLMGLIAGSTTDPRRWPTPMRRQATTCRPWVIRRSIP